MLIASLQPRIVLFPHANCETSQIVGRLTEGDAKKLSGKKVDPDGEVVDRGKSYSQTGFVFLMGVESVGLSQSCHNSLALAS